ncbi:TPA: aminotransferase DegT [candidate division CPR2 bacterium]|uniref:Aminotransferase DegT/DnrJ/EryC1/StrS family n=1 Tax=candidate division CPR2 bacterium GW2011_GWC1_41_48 TaxID=1618344 RepID=A0A0G0YGJ1_UNCC2|nr:MAG: Aminotransferase DegT/DnrJ/EryC1/StrS family [candidate division CPR2 bacterium GW2011_GWC2_39_35]KKR28752.1 MAG: Aminotransferase DegT/DnrJ/EryC1/StrS family [candidate division CPR2 bacterium GW2011_GWD2_39_7]KKS08661.1 MAG: Aminotransferase DegT/DnrJ/EryC1/StrS family [candidate division CPR2 bacterium GW2011_GWC1_41_48]HBG81389.1 aminotransferase DegT [candidate division CPR2 bacterium]HCL99328.1 aminotransferase DegT [candidate division CPR2 bacterium]
MIPIAKPIIGEEEKKAVLKVLDSGSLAQGPEVEAFEKEFAGFCNADYAIAASSGTTALHLALEALGIGEGDEVITTPFSFIASSNSILYSGATPVFADIDEETFNIDPKKIEKLINHKTKAILPVHLYGLAANMPEILKIAEKYDLKVIEDACQAHGAKIDGRPVGSFGDAACFSFYPTKNMTTGEGGMATFKHKETYENALMLRAHGMRIRYHHEILGYNYRMTDIHASIGREQLKKLPGFNKKRQDNAKYFTDNIKNAKIKLPNTPKGYEHVFHQFTIVINDRDKALDKLVANGIGTGIHYPVGINDQPLYKEMNCSAFKTPISKKVSSHVISIPVHPSLTKKELETIVKTVNSV